MKEASSDVYAKVELSLANDGDGESRQGEGGALAQLEALRGQRSFERSHIRWKGLSIE